MWALREPLHFNSLFNFFPDIAHMNRSYQVHKTQKIINLRWIFAFVKKAGKNLQWEISNVWIFHFYRSWILIKWRNRPQSFYIVSFQIMFIFQWTCAQPWFTIYFTEFTTSQKDLKKVHAVCWTDTKAYTYEKLSPYIKKVTLSSIAIFQVLMLYTAFDCMQTQTVYEYAP